VTTALRDDVFSFQRLGSWDATQASPERLFGGERSIRPARRARQSNPRYVEALSEAVNLVERVQAGDRYAGLQFTEAMSTSDFSFLFADILDRQILARYQQMPVQWDRVARRGRVRDFRTVKRFTLDGGEATLSAVPQLTEYPMAALTDNGYSYSVQKYGRRIGLSWESIINDDLDAFTDIPDRLSNAARRSEERFVTALYAGASGPNGTFFASGNKNLVTGNPTLSITALQSAFTLLASQLDNDGAPIYIDGVTLVVPPALSVVAQNIMNATEIITAVGSGGASSDAGRQDRLRTVNWMANRVTLITNPWLPLISSTANGSTSWYLFADPNQGRPAMEIGFLVGHEVPDLFAKSPNATRIGGGPVAPEDGDFDVDGVDWKIRHVLGGTLMDPKMGVASNGSGS
jgi:hypothetical protein